MINKWYMLTDELPKTGENIDFCTRIVNHIIKDYPGVARTELRGNNLCVMITEDYLIMCETYVREHCGTKTMLRKEKAA